jgi:hypothetical protein
MVGQQEIHQIAQNVGAWYGVAQFLEQCLQVFFGGLLAMKTELVMKGLASPGELGG